MGMIKLILVISCDYDDLKQTLNNIGKKDIDKLEDDIYLVKFNNYKTLFIKVGCTKVEITKKIVEICTKYPIKIILGIGNCATINTKYHLGDIAIINSSVQYDVDFTAIGLPKSMIPNINKRIFLANNKLIDLIKNNYHEDNIHYGEISSGDRFISSNNLSNLIKTTIKSDFIDNESSIIMEIAYLYNIPSLIIKGISNYATNNSYEVYLKNKQEANIKALYKIIHLINTLIETGY